MRNESDLARLASASQPEALLLEGSQGEVLHLNPAAERLFGCTASADPGLETGRLLRPLGSGLESIRSRARTGGPIAFDALACFPDGREGGVPVTGLAAPADDVEAGVAGVVYSLRPARPGSAGFFTLFEQLPVAVAAFDRDMRYLAASRPWIESFGLDADALIGRCHYELFPEIPQRWKDFHVRGLAGESLRSDEDRFQQEGGPLHQLRWRLEPWRRTDGSVGGLLLYSEDNRPTLELQRNLSETEDLYSRLFEFTDLGILISDEQGTYIEGNPAICRMLERSHEEIVGLHATEIIEAQDQDQFAPAIEEVRSGGEHERVWTLRTRSGSIFRAKVHATRLPGGLLLSYVEDITQQLEAEAERKRLEERLLQAQRMESIGRLAGGVAHDFNNMLSVILGYSELTISRAPPDSPLLPDLEEIRTAAERSAALTRQLLAFARHQAASLQVLDLNEVISDLLKLLERLIGEDVDLAWFPGEELGRIEMDPSQVGQILTNLCVNARDALPGGGKITIETAMAHFDDEASSSRTDVRPGTYVMLVVSDDGAGMPPEVRERVFEPYFTTKGMGEGTGLGLSTVYGIVKQNQGFIHVYSEEGQGTTFKIYLAVSNAQHAAPMARPPRTVALRGGGHVLLVEDEAMILELGVKMLRSLGYEVVAASRPNEALKLAREHARRLDLLITDVVMPEMNGRELADRVREICPDIEVVYLSGYTANVIAHHGILKGGVRLLSKPFTRNEMADTVRAALNV